MAEKKTEKKDKDSLTRVDPMVLTDYPEPFYSTKAVRLSPPFAQRYSSSSTPDGSLKDGWVRDWKNGGKLVYKGDPDALKPPTKEDLTPAVKADKDTLGRVELLI